ncbi:hypothetical protein ACOI22_00580 [Glaciecola sp. 2405UD65-10]|uniref:hypothetical protein n=1 Tax=Glaciecola sp. 2405UD65-10 TaxID=3397244 RepID=UPI003B5A6936
MNEQAFKDMEEYALGQTGVVTGSMHNTAGLQDRPTRSNSYTPATPRKQTKVRSTNKKVQHTSSAKKADDGSLAILFFIIGFIASCYLMSQNNVVEPAAYIIGGVIGGGISAALHKVIIAVGFLALCLFIIGAING